MIVYVRSSTWILQEVASPIAIWGVNELAVLPACSMIALLIIWLTGIIFWEAVTSIHRNKLVISWSVRKRSCVACLTFTICEITVVIRIFSASFNCRRRCTVRRTDVQARSAGEVTSLGGIAVTFRSDFGAQRPRLVEVVNVALVYVVVTD